MIITTNRWMVEPSTTTTTTSTSQNVITSQIVYPVVGTINIPTRKQTYKCEYCDCLSEEAGTCKHCGAPLKEVSE